MFGFKKNTAVSAPPKRKKNRKRRRYYGLGKERNYFVENLSMLVGGGMNMPAAIDAIAVEMRSKAMRTILADLKDDIQGGSPLWKALNQTGIFRDYTISLIRTGEESGRLAENLKLIAIQDEKDRSFRSKIRGAMMYPVLVLTVTVIMGGAIAWFILPRLASVFSQMHIELPAITQALITTGIFLGEYGYMVIPAIAVAIITLMYFVFSFKKTRFIGQSILFHIPGVKALLQEIELARFGYLLGTLLCASIPVTDSLESLRTSSTFVRYQKLYAFLRDSLAEGNSFQKGFAAYKHTNKLIPSPVQQLIVAGEQSGTLADTLLKVSERYESRIDNTTKNLSVILEPILLVIVWLGVVSVALAVILPIYNLIGGFSAGVNQNTTSAPRAEESEEANLSFEDLVSTASSTVATEGEAATSTEVEGPQLIILDTGLGYLNVRSDTSTESEIVKEAYPDEIYTYTDEVDGWYEIQLPDGTYGWVAGRYVRTLEN